MKKVIFGMVIMGLSGCGTGNLTITKSYVDNGSQYAKLGSLVHISSASTEYDVVSILGAPDSIKDGAYEYTLSSNVQSNQVEITFSYNSAFEAAWNQVGLVNDSNGNATSYAALQSYIDNYLTNNLGNQQIAAQYILVIDSFKASQGSNITHVVGLTLNGQVQSI